MKKNKNKALVYSFAICMSILIGCENPEIPGTERIVSFPSIEFEQQEIIITKGSGDTFTEDVQAFVGADPTNVTISGDVVDVNTAGIYIIEYSATSPDGFDASARRIVVVVENAASTCNLTGTYARTNGTPNTISLATDNPFGVPADRLYQTSNAGGFPADGTDPNALQIKMINVNDNLLYIPFQTDEDSGLTVQSVVDGTQPLGNIVDCTGGVAQNIIYYMNVSAVFGTFGRDMVRQ